MDDRAFSPCDCPLCKRPPHAWLVVALALVLTACGQVAPEPTAAERAAGAATVQAWREAGLPEPAEECAIERFRISRPESDRAFMWSCRQLPADAWGCLRWTTSNRMFDATRYPVVVMSPSFPPNLYIIAHELVHALAVCSGVPDDHENAALWSGPTSVVARAWERLPR